MGANVWADNLNATVKMTYINGSAADASYGEVETAYCGYNKISGGKVELANSGWGVNNIAYLQIDASAVPAGATITNASLSVDCQQISARGLNYGVGYNTSAWSSTLTWNTADRSITTMGSVINGSKTTTDKTNVFDISAAFAGDEDNIVTILVYQTAAGAGYVKNPVATITYTMESAYSVTFTETNGVDAKVTLSGLDVTGGTTLVNGTYNFTATASGYYDYAGSFTVEGADKNVEFAMTAKTPVSSITVNYTYEGNIIASETQENISGLYVGDSYNVPFRMYVMKDGALYRTTERTSNPYYGEPVTLEANVVVEKALSAVDLNGGIIELFEDLDNTTAQNAGIRASYCSAYDNTNYESAEELPAGVYTLMCRVQSQTRGSMIKIGEIEFDVLNGLGKGSWNNVTIKDVVVPTAGKLTIAAGSSNTRDDYDVIIAIRKAVSATIGATGYTTFASASALDLSDLPDGLTAFKAASVGENSVTFSSVDTAVPTGTGLLLKGNAGTSYSIPVAASAETLSGNKLVGCTEETVLAANENYYVMVNNGGTAEFQSLKTNGATIPAGKAYLNAAAAGARLSFVFANETTGISTVENANVLNENYYNLNGQRIAAPQKGLFIVNGKKVIIK